MAALLIASVIGALVLAGISTGLAAITVLLREDLTPRALAAILVGQVGRITALECALVVVLALGYLEVGWRAPLLVAGFVLLIWDNHPMPPPDLLTGMPGKEGFGRRLEAGVGRMRRGITPSAAVLHIDLDHFKRINDIHLYDVGDEVLAEVGARLRAHARRADDLVGRLGGDEFAMFLPGLADPVLATERADAIVADLCRPIATTAGTMHIGASIGVVVVQAWGGVPSGGALLAQAAAAMHVAKQAGGGSHLYDPDEPLVASRTGGPSAGSAPDQRLAVLADERASGREPSRVERAMSTVVADPSRISSAIPRPTAGAVLKPVPLWPQSR